MVFQPPAYRDVQWYIKVTELGIFCAYIDLNSRMFPKGTELTLCAINVLVPGGITYQSKGLCESGYDDIQPDHEFIGWDYGHDIDVVCGEKPGPSLEQIEQDAKTAIDLLFEKMDVDLLFEKIDGPMRQKA